MIQMVYNVMGAFALTVIVCVILEAMNQRAMSKLAVLSGILTITVAFFSWFMPTFNDSKAKIGKIGNDINNFSKSIDRVGNGLEKIGATKENIDKAVDKTKIPFLDKIDKAIEDKFNELTGGE